jgi:Mg2+-importing ATPase
MIIKRLDSIQNFGAMDVLCTDKTGTLTQDKIFLERHTDVFGQESDTVLNDAYLNSYYQTGLKNLLDVAVSEHADVHQELTINTAYRKVDEIPFYLVRRRMSVMVAKQTAERSPAVDTDWMAPKASYRNRREPCSGMAEAGIQVAFL